ncbi:MAG: hypothetical protein NT027_17960 [Proteobacteria bacterium]|nr:hypothetical protein [Pseudomonadota bacterium]
MNKSKMFVHLGAIIGVLSILLYLNQNCGRKASDSNLADIATSSKLKTGLFLPLSDSETDLSTAKSYRISTPSQLAELLEISTNGNDTYRTSTSLAGENLLIVEREGMMPMPLVSLTADKKRNQWSFFVMATEKGEKLNSNVYIRHELGTNPMPFVNETGTESNLFMYRTPLNDLGTAEPMLVSWLNHIVAPDGSVLYRIGNTVIDAVGNQPILSFASIGKNMWELTGYYSDADLFPGTVFWKEDDKNYFSFSPTVKKVVHWIKQDDNSMDKSQVYTSWEKRGSKADYIEGEKVFVPDEVVAAVFFREKQGFGVKGRVIPVHAPKSLNAGHENFPLYADDSMYSGGVKRESRDSFGLSSNLDSSRFIDSDYEALTASGAVSMDDESNNGSNALALGEVSNTGPKPGQIASVTNWNNGAKFGQVRIISNEPHMVPRGSINSVVSGKSDYVGYKYIGEILTKDGQGTGQFVEQTYNKEAGAYNQRLLSRSQLVANSASTIAAKEDKIRQINNQIRESQREANGYAGRSDALANEAYKRAKELPGKVISSSTTAIVTDKFGIGKTGTPNQQAAAWLATGAAKESANQAINISLDRLTAGSVGTKDFSGSKIVTASMSTLVGKSASSDLNESVIGTTTKAAVEKVTSAGVKTSVDTLAGKNDGRSSYDVGALAVADTAVDVTFSALGNTAAAAGGGPLAKAVAAGGAEIVKVGNAEVGALALTGKELSSRTKLNAQQTQGLQTLSGVRQSNDVLNYLNSNPSH